MAIDFDGLSARLIPQLRELLPVWYPNGKFQGAEFVVGDVKGAPGKSFSINIARGIAKDFATGESFSDPIAIYAGLRDISMAAAARELGGLPDDLPPPRTNGNGTHAPDPIPEASPAPVDYVPPPPHFKYGPATATYPYHGSDLQSGPLFLVCRYEQPGERKQFVPYTWRGGKWHHKAYPAPRPLYRLRDLVVDPDLPVLIVEGEKACHAAMSVLPTHVVVTWAGGAEATRTVDWKPLAGRTVTLWPDADEAGRKAVAVISARLLELKCALSIVPIDGRPDGWDAADAVAERVDIPALIATAKPVATVTPIQSAKTSRITRAQPQRAEGAIVTPDGSVEDDGSCFVSWEALGLDKPSKGAPFATIGNVVRALSNHEDLKGKIWLDSFRHRIYHELHGRVEPWTDADALRLAAWFHQVLRLPKFSLQVIHHGVELYAANHARNSVTHWLESLIWDGTPRLCDWLSDCFGVAKTAFTIAVARNWLISMVARAYRPGCQADHMPVLEGLSGAGKSSALSILGGEWYRAAPQAFGSKEFFEAIQGAWLVEIPDMVGFGKREHAQIISAITTRNDTFRASYGRNAEDHLRTTIFAATSETDEYLQDSRGKRRYWPLECTEIRLDVLRANRDQIFAEATDAFKNGASWHEVPAEEAAQEQNRREESDPWLTRIETYVGTRLLITTSEVASEGLFLEIGKQDRAVQMRISKCLKTLGFSCKVEWTNGRPQRLYRR